MTRRYPAYRDSGVQWLGEVPEGWAVSCVKRVASIKYGIGEPPRYRDEGVPLIRATNVDAGRICTDGLVLIDPADIPANRITWLSPGDIIVVRSGAYTGDSAIIGPGHCPAVAGFDMVLKPVSIYPPFLAFLLLSSEVKQSQIDLEKMRAAQPHLNAEEIGSCIIPLPPLPEQTAIAAFLDRETAKIDALVAEQRRLIDLLREKRQAVISHAVTKGLNPNAPLKPSGIDWLGDVPEGWEVKRLRFLCRIETGASDTQDADEDAEFPFFVRSQTVEKIGHFTHDCEAVMTSGDGAGVGKIFHHFKGKFSAHQRVYIFTDFEGVSAEFFFHYLRANFFKVALEGGAKSTVDSLRRPLIANFWMTVPPLEEQEEILADVAEIERRYSLLAEDAEAAIALLQERRAALISAAVTGKIDVRGLAHEETEAA